MSRTTQLPWYSDALEAKLREMAAEGELPDVITFAGNGEPTAAPEFPQAIAGAVALRDELAPNSKIAVLSNGTRADRPQVHDALMMVDDNILKLDTVDPAFIQLLDQPVGPYDVEHQIETSQLKRSCHYPDDVFERRVLGQASR